MNGWLKLTQSKLHSCIYKSQIHIAHGTIGGAVKSMYRGDVSIAVKIRSHVCITNTIFSQYNCIDLHLENPAKPVLWSEQMVVTVVSKWGRAD